MAAGQGFIEFSTGDVLTAAAANGYLASQVVMVFADATARTSAIASPQEGMFSYLKDTNTTQYYSGSAWVTIGGASSSGLTKIQTGTFTSSSAVNVNSVFSATYKNYMFVAEVTNSSNDNDVRLRLRSSGTDATTNYSILGAISAGASVSADNSTGSFPVIRAGGTTMGFGDAIIFSPFTASYTGWTSTSIGAAGYWASQSGRHTANTSYDGFSLIPSSGTITGTYTLYGMEA
jgi:hypothetical protein